jgi:dihydrofolate reductase
MLYGRTTYEMLNSYCPKLKNNEMGVADKLNSVKKYVVSTTMKKADWENTTIIDKNVIEEIAALKICRENRSF